MINSFCATAQLLCDFEINAVSQFNYGNSGNFNITPPHNSVNNYIMYSIDPQDPYIYRPQAAYI